MKKSKNTSTYNVRYATVFFKKVKEKKGISRVKTSTTGKYTKAEDLD